jgi:hypothetical protein
LPGDRSDPIEVGVVVENGKAARLRGGGNQEIGHLATALVLGRKQTLNLPGPPHVLGSRLHKRKGLKGLRESIPLGGTASRVANLEVAYSGSSEFAALGCRLDCIADRRMMEARENA